MKLPINEKGSDSYLYMDANATEILRPSAFQALAAASRVVGNSSSIHMAGRSARSLLEDAREKISNFFGALPENCILTSGGTESNILALAGLRQDRELMVGATEHLSILNTVSDALILPVHSNGYLNLGKLKEYLLISRKSAFVCLMLANNETGIIHPMDEIVSLCQRYQAWLHVDAVQAAGRIPINMARLGADSITISGHKMGGIKGAGALILADRHRYIPFKPLFIGGGQERGRRGGTPAIPAIVTMAVAAVDTQHTDWEQIAKWRDRIDTVAASVGAQVNGFGSCRLPNTTNLLLAGCSASTQLMILDLMGIAVSAGSACSAGKMEPSHVLMAMGLGELAQESIRISLSWSVKEDDIDLFCNCYVKMAQQLQRRHNKIS